MKEGLSLNSAEVHSLSSTTELMEREWSPCRYHCPAHADVRTYIEAAAQGRFRDAIDIIRENLPFAAVCGRVCHHPCENNCRRGDVDEPVAIREVKRFVAETQGVSGCTVRRPVSQNRARVAVVGGGPAGLSAALDLAKLGYRPTVFEKFDVPGGIPATAIPPYRLPREVVRIDVEWIRAHGVEIRTGVEIGTDKLLTDLPREGFDATIIATGLPRSRPLPMENADRPRVYPALSFLTDAAFGPPPEVGRRVLVIGGGNVACDAGRTALRLGAEHVTLMCLENPAEMPAWSWELREATEEGIEIVHRRGPVGVLVEGERVTGVRTRKVTRVFDPDGRFAPTYDDSDLRDEPCETVIIAIGQMPDTGFAAGSDLQVEGNRLAWDTTTHRTNLPGVFACGEVVTAPGSVVEACAHGRRAARAVHLHLSGEPIEIDDPLPPAIDPIAPPASECVPRVERTPTRVVEPERRARSFDEFESTYTEGEALREARRCMNCGGGAEVLADKCAACLTCARVCPFDVPAVTDVARIDSALCQSCGICIPECPANAIVARSREVRDLRRRTAAALANLDTDRKLVAYICGHHATADDWTGRTPAGIDGLAEIYLPSTSQLGAPDMLDAFEHGAEAVFVVACTDGADRYPGTLDRTRRRIAQVRGWLAEVGLDGERVVLLPVAQNGRPAIRDALAETARRLLPVPAEAK